jgi:hypothetical protein
MPPISVNLLLRVVGMLCINFDQPEPYWRAHKVMVLLELSFC